MSERKKRAPRGSIAHAVLVRMPADLAAATREAAEREGVTVVEWVRRAMRERLERSGR